MKTFFLLALAASSLGAARLPTDDSEVVERVPARNDPRSRETRGLEEQVRSHPGDAAVAVRAARRLLDIGREEGDPRWTGRAQSVLAPWWNEDQPPRAVRVLRAAVRQNLHDFPGALADLDRAVTDDPADAQAWLTRAAVQQVRGDYAAARISCGPLVPLARPLVAATCLTTVASLTGNLKPALAFLLRTFDQDDGAEPAVTRWALASLAEMSARAGDARAAGSWYRKALALGGPEAYLLASYADFLLDQGKAAEARDLLRDSARSDALLLRLSLAEKALGDPALASHVEALRQRFEESRLRGDVIHRREEAMFRLWLLGDAEGALALAHDNWQVQKEPLDARILLEAAKAAGKPAEAKPVLAFLDGAHLEDSSLSRLRSGE